MPLAPTVPRELAGSVTLVRPQTAPKRSTAADNAKTEVLKCGGNTQLMEARLCQITSSVRALIRSNKDLEEALLTAPGDPDFLQAIGENQLIIRRHGQTARALVEEMQSQGCNVELEEDIRLVAEAESDGITAVVFGSAPAASENGGINAASNTERADDGGMFL